MTSPGGEVELFSSVEVKSPYGQDNWQVDHFVMRVEPDAYVVCRHYVSENMGSKFSQLGIPARYPTDRVRLSDKAPKIIGWTQTEYLKVYGASHLKSMTIVNC